MFNFIQWCKDYFAQLQEREAERERLRDEKIDELERIMAEAAEKLEKLEKEEEER